MTPDNLPPTGGEDSGDSLDLEAGRVFDAFLADLEAGHPADPERLLADHPHLADHLRVCLEVMDWAGHAMGGPEGDSGPIRHDHDAPAAGSNSLNLNRPNDEDLPQFVLRDPPGSLPPLLRPAFLTAQSARALVAGRYRLLGEIARGGMGAVFKGYDADLGRDLAIKVLLRKHEGDHDVRHRFIDEAQIGGQLQHPGIVPVYELGIFQGRRPYFAMKLVQGRTLAVLLAERPDPAHDPPRFLQVFEQVCQTMAYAHARGVVHRDLKPSNVMVGSFGEVQVLDWGLAKVLARRGAADDVAAAQRDDRETVIAAVRSGSEGDRSRAGSVVGTPAYMAPEQARGEGDRLDERADVFALGSILCEILTGRPAFLGRSSGEIHHKAAQGDLADAFARLEGCGADTELVALARDCLAPERDDRPREAGAVAERCVAYRQSIEQRLRAAELERATESARAEEAGRRVLVERQRRRYQLGLAASVLALSVLGGLSSTYLLQQRQARAAREALAVREAILLRDQAVASPEDMAKWEAAARAVESAAREQPEGAAARRLAVLQSEVERGLLAARRDRELIDALTDVRTSQEDLGVSGVDDAYTRTFRDAGLDVDGTPPAEVGAAIRARPTSVALVTAEALDDWAKVRRGLKASDLRWRRPLEVARAADHDPFRDKVRAVLLDPGTTSGEAALRALAADPKAAELPPASAVLLAKSLSGREEAVTLLRAVAGRHPDDVWANYVLAESLGTLKPAPREEMVRYFSAARALRPETAHSLAHLLSEMGRVDEALVVFADLIARRPSVARHLTCYALCLKNHGRPGSAPLLDRAVATASEAIRAKPNDAVIRFSLGHALAQQGKRDEAIAEYHAAIRLKPDSADAHFSLGLTLCAQGKLDEAVTEYRTALRLKPDSADAHNNLGNVLRAQGKDDEAIAEFHEALRLKPDHAIPHTNLGNVLQAQGKHDEAVAEYHAALRLRPDDADAHYNLGLALHAKGKRDGAVTELREALRLKPDYADAHFSLGLALRAQRKHDEAIAEFRAALRLKPDYANAHYSLGNALQVQGKRDEAVAEYRAALRLKPDSADAHNDLGTVLRAQGKDDEAIAEFHAALRLKPDYADAHNNLGVGLLALGRFDEAVAEFHEALRLKPDYAVAHNNLGTVLQAQGKHDEAIAEFRAALRLKPDYANAHYSLGNALQAQGKLDEAVAAYRRTEKLSSLGTPLARAISGRIRQVEQQIALASRLSAVLRQEERPRNTAEMLSFAQLAYDRKHFAAAVRLWSDALVTDPRFADNRQTQHSYNAACAATLAGCGQGQDDPLPDEATRVKLRHQALDWLKGELSRWAKLLESGPRQARPVVVQTLQHWKVDTDLAGVRDPDAMARLPEPERKNWQALWAQVDELLHRAQTGDLPKPVAPEGVFPDDPFSF
jgi:serine/threonine-protein kinase